MDRQEKNRQKKNREMRGKQSHKNSSGIKPHYKIPEWVERKRNEKQRYVRNTRSRFYKDEDEVINDDYMRMRDDD